MAANDAAIAERNAKDAIVAGQREKQESRLRHNQRIAALRARAGASGLDVGAGSALDAVADGTLMKEYDTLSIRDTARRRADNYGRQAADPATQGAMVTAAGGGAAFGGLWNAAESLLDGAGSVAGSWYKYKKGRAWP